MDKDEFGRHQWITMHAYAGNALTQTKRNAFCRYVRTIPDVFSCDVCGQHFAEFIRKNSPEKSAGSAEALLYWTYLAHNGATQHYNADPDNKTKKKIPRFEDIKNLYLAQEDTSPIEAVKKPNLIQTFMSNFSKKS